jgi:hypothetical protein
MFANAVMSRCDVCHSGLVWLPHIASRCGVPAGWEVAGHATPADLPPSTRGKVARHGGYPWSASPASWIRARRQPVSA